MYFIFLTWLVAQAEMSPSNAGSPSNMSSASVTLLVSHFKMFPLNFPCEKNVHG